MPGAGDVRAATRTPGKPRRRASGAAMMSPHSGLSAIDRALTRWSRARIAVVSLAVTLLVGAVDFTTGYEISFSLFYLLPVSLSAWYAGLRAGAAMALVAGVVWLTADVLAGHAYSHPAIPFWNALVRLGFFLSNGLLVATLRARLMGERRLARTDALTGLHNHRSFWERLEYGIALARPITLVHADVDDFKRVNDTYGQDGGDRVLRTIGAALAEATRRTDIAARLGGGEFALVPPETGEAGARELIAKVRERMNSAPQDAGYPVTSSVGAMTFLSAPASAEEAVRAADGLMYKVKKHGKNAVAFGVAGDAAASMPPRTVVADGKGGAAEI